MVVRADFQLAQLLFARESKIYLVGFNGMHGKFLGIHTDTQGHMVCVDTHICRFGCAVDLLFISTAKAWDSVLLGIVCGIHRDSRGKHWGARDAEFFFFGIHAR